MVVIIFSFVRQLGGGGGRFCFLLLVLGTCDACASSQPKIAMEVIWKLNMHKLMLILLTKQLSDIRMLNPIRKIDFYVHFKSNALILTVFVAEYCRCVLCVHRSSVLKCLYCFWKGRKSNLKVEQQFVQVQSWLQYILVQGSNGLECGTIVSPKCSRS